MNYKKQNKLKQKTHKYYTQPRINNQNIPYNLEINQNKTQRTIKITEIIDIFQNEAIITATKPAIITYLISTEKPTIQITILFINEQGQPETFEQIYQLSQENMQQIEQYCLCKCEAVSIQIQSHQQGSDSIKNNIQMAFIHGNIKPKMPNDIKQLLQQTNQYQTTNNLNMRNDYLTKSIQNPISITEQSLTHYNAEAKCIGIIFTNTDNNIYENLEKLPIIQVTFTITQTNPNIEIRSIEEETQFKLP